jgi:hypothetical protein
MKTVKVVTEVASDQAALFAAQPTPTNGEDRESTTVTPIPIRSAASPSAADAADRQVADEFEELAADTILDDDDGDEPGAKDEISEIEVRKNLPRFSNFRTNPTTFDLWGITDRQGMDDMIFVTTKSFAPNFEDDADLQRVRFYETVTTDNVVRLVYCFVPEKSGRKPLASQTSKISALELGMTTWATMRWRKKLMQYTYRPARKDYGPPKFSGFTPQQFALKLKEQGLLVINKDHPFFKKATDSEE